MSNRDKVIRVLEGSYKNSVFRHNGELVTVTEVLVLLKAQEPHLITKADFADNPMIDDGGYLPAWVEFNREKYGEFFEENADGWGCVNINKVGNDMARYWTAKPSLKQMEVTPWE